MAGLTIHNLETEIESLQTLDLDGLRQCWRTHFRKSIPTNLPKNLLRSLLAYRLQALIHGDLDKPGLQFLEQLIVQGGASGKPLDMAMPRNNAFKPGTILARDHGGVRHHVTVLEDGLAWNGKTYSSLSQVAHAITGTKWNGRRFFGLCDRKEASR